MELAQEAFLPAVSTSLVLMGKKWSLKDSSYFFMTFECEYINILFISLLFVREKKSPLWPAGNIPSHFKIPIQLASLNECNSGF